MLQAGELLCLSLWSAGARVLRRNREGSPLLSYPFSGTIVCVRFQSIQQSTFELQLLNLVNFWPDIILHVCE